ncbi:MAG: biosynthetic-type acetolactate synthase large subunit [Treponema sp.]|jgi:acetolactate synthase-1/2/3 large subunit|nr:biosynthetic-type acetolactate synthase large subunit [Treponema sp.]
MKYSGARILVEALIEEGVDTVFGIPGGYVLQIYDELYRCRDRIRHILVSHEQHAAHAADGYARSSGRVGVCIATSGPGATNLVTGIAAAHMDSSPLVAVTGNVPSGLLGKDSFQETDIAGITMPVVKHNWIVKDVRELAEVVREAFIVARTGRPGPVLIDIPADISGAETEWKPAAAAAWEDGDVLGSRARRLSERGERITFTGGDIEAAAEMLLSAKRPMIYAGGGVNNSGASEELTLLADVLNAPVALSLMGIGAVPRDYPLCTGLIGMHGTVASNKLVQKADLLAVVGARFSDRVTSRSDHFARHAKILHIDIDPAEINKNRPADLSVIGDAKKVLAAILKKLPRSADNRWDGELERLKERGAVSRRTKERNQARPPLPSPRFVVEFTAKRMSFNTLVVTDVGQHQIWVAQHYPIARPRSFISSGGLGAMGFGLGAALGAKTANPERPVVLFTGDGSFRMNNGELATLSRYRVALLIILFNNGSLGMVRQWQQVFHGGTYSETDLSRSPDFTALAAAYGIPAYRAASEADYVSALDAALDETAKGSSAFIEVFIDRDEAVLPMVPGGRPVDEQIL